MDDRAAASSVAFLFAGVIFVAGLSALLVNTDGIEGRAASGEQQASLLGLQATSIRDTLLKSPGYSQYATGEALDWLDPTPAGQSKKPTDVLQRFGLLQAGTPNIDFNKLVNLRSAPYAADDTDGYLNYEEARKSLGLDVNGFDFHVRAYPSLKSVQDILATGTKDQNLRVTYVGDAISSSEAEVIAASHPPPVGTPTCILSPDGSGRSLLIVLPVTNDGQVTTQFNAAFTVEFGSNAFTDFQRGPIAAVTETVGIQVLVPAKFGDCDSVTKLKATVLDPGTSLVTAEWTPTWGTTAVAAATKWFTVDPDTETYLATDSVIITYAGELVATQGDTDGETVSFKVLNSAGVDVTPAAPYVASMVVPKANKPWVFPSFTASQLGPDGNYTVMFTRSNGETVSDQIIIAPAPANYNPPGGAAAGPTSYTYADSAKTEVEFLEKLVSRFCPYEWDNKAATPMTPTWAGGWANRCDTGLYRAHSAAKEALSQWGDVFPDDKQLLGNELHRRLAPGGVASLDIVNTLVIGSNVDHNTMTSNAVKGAIAEWVTEAGGTLIVFGSEKQVVNWLNPIFKTKLDTSGNGLSAPDLHHPILRVADDLAWDQYDDRGRAWDLKESDDTAKAFTKVVHDNTAEKNAILAISDPGAFGQGTVILTSWLPYDLFDDGSTGDGPAFINNLLMQGYRDLFLDYGPEIPEGGNTIPAPAVAHVFHPRLERYVTLSINVYVFESA